MLIDSILPEGIDFIGAASGDGKTLMGLSISKALTTGSKFLGKWDVPERTHVIYLIPEVGDAAFRQRIKSFQINEEDGWFRCMTISAGMIMALDSPILRQAVEELKPVIILDTMIRFSTAEDENSSAQNRKLAQDILSLRAAGSPAVICLHHSTKDAKRVGMTLDKVLRGTGDIAALSDVVYGVQRDDALYKNGMGPNEMDVICAKARDVMPPLPFRVAASRKTGDDRIGIAKGIESIIDATGDIQLISESDTLATKAANLIQLVQDDPSMSLKELSDATATPTWVVRQTLKKHGWAKKKGKGGQWERKDETRIAPTGG